MTGKRWLAYFFFVWYTWWINVYPEALLGKRELSFSISIECGFGTTYEYFLVKDKLYFTFPSSLKVYFLVHLTESRVSWS